MALENLRGLSQDDQFEAAAAYAGVPASVLRGIWRTESGEGKHMLSPAGAEGHFQIMPATRRTWEGRIGRKLDPYDFTDGLTLAALSMRENLQATGGDIPDALRMYNAGPNRARWNNAETQAYAAKVLGTDAAMSTSAHSLRSPGTRRPSAEEAWTTSAYDIQDLANRNASGSASRQYLSDVERGLVEQAGIEAAVDAAVTGQDPVLASTNARRSVRENAPATATRAIAALGELPIGTGGDTEGWEAVLNQAATEEQRQREEDAITVGDKFGAAFDNNTLTAGILHYIEREHGPTSRPDPNWYYMDHIDETEKDRTEDEITELREARSQGEVGLIRARQDRERENDRIVATGSSGAAVIGYNLAAGVADPVGWAAGLGAGKVFQLAGVGSRAAFAAGNTARGFLLAGAEGATGNLLTTAALDAAGEHQSTNDYAASAGFGLLMGSGFAALEWRGAARVRAQQELADMGERLRQSAAEQNAQLYQQAEAEAGPGATPEQIAAAATRINAEQESRILDTVFGDVPDSMRMFPRPDVGAAPPSATGSALPNAILNTQRKRRAAYRRYGLDVSIADDAERLLVAEVFTRAERILGENPVDAARLRPLMSRLGWEATSTRMLLSDNPVMRAFAVVALENPEGAAGRKVTAAMTKSMRERVYLGNAIRDHENAYAVWRNRNGGSGLRDFYDDTYRRRFNRLVYAERDRRWNERAGGETDREVLAAADVLDAAYRRMGADQAYAGTIGSGRLDYMKPGYQPREAAYGFVGNMNQAQTRAFVSAWSQEFQVTAGWDKEFSDRFAVHYLERIRTHAKGAYDVPVNLQHPDAADMIRDSLRALSLNEEQISQVMGRFSRGGASHTKARIDADLTTMYDDGAGGNLQLMDMVQTDGIYLLRKYARRVSGEVSLAKYGIMGEQGLKLLRKAMSIGDNAASNPELAAFDQVAAEFLGKPFGNQLGKWADNARSFTSALRLGGMGFNQFNEYANGVASLGVSRSFKALTALPRLMGEVRELKSGRPAKNSLLGSMELYGGEFGMDGYRMQGMYDVNEGFEVYGTEALTVFDKAVRAGAHANRILSGHRALTAVQIRGMAEQIVQKSLRYIREGAEDAALDDMGINAAVREAMRADLSRVATFGADGEVLSFDITKLRDNAAAHAYMVAVQRGASQIIQETYIGETGKWAHDGWLKLLTQFRTYGITATQKQWRRQAFTHGTVRALGFLLGAMSVALPIHLARVQLRALGRNDREEFLDRELSPVALGRATMNYVSSVGLLPDVLDIGSSVVGADITGGRAGNTSPLVGGQIVPAAGVVNDVWRAAQTKDPHRMVKLLPGSNLPYLQGAINQLDE